MVKVFEWFSGEEGILEWMLGLRTCRIVAIVMSQNVQCYKSFSVCFVVDCILGEIVCSCIERRVLKTPMHIRRIY